MITLSNGHSFQLMAASGALAFDGRGWPWEWPLRWMGLLDPKLFTIVTKTLTRKPRRGNLRWSHPWSVVKRVGRDGVVNAIGLTNKGFDWWISEVAPTIPEDYRIIVSLEADDETDILFMLEGLRGQNILGVELNLSCPNTPASDSRTTDHILKIGRAASACSPFPLIAKLSCMHDYTAVARGIAGSVEAISINSIPWPVLFPDVKSPLHHFGGGGVSGKIIQLHTWKMVHELSKASTIPIIGPSIWDYDDIQKVIDHGASAVSFGSVFVFHPWRPTRYVRRWIREHPDSA